MKEQFVTIEIAKRLRELGFNEECFTYWEDKYTGIEGIPLWQQAIDWLEKEKHIIVEENMYYSFNKQKWGIAYVNCPDFKEDVLTTFYDSKYKAREQAILKALELIK